MTTYDDFIVKFLPKKLFQSFARIKKNRQYDIEATTMEPKMSFQSFTRKKKNMQHWRQLPWPKLLTLDAWTFSHVFGCAI